MDSFSGYLRQIISENFTERYVKKKFRVIAKHYSIDDQVKYRDINLFIDRWINALQCSTLWQHLYSFDHEKFIKLGLQFEKHPKDLLFSLLIMMCLDSICRKIKLNHRTRKKIALGRWGKKPDNPGLFQIIKLYFVSSDEWFPHVDDDAKIFILPMNIVSALAAEFINFGYTQNVKNGMALLKMSFKDRRLNPNAKTNHKFDIHREWVDLYQLWNIVFVIREYRNHADVQLLTKLLFPMILKAKRKEFIDIRTNSLRMMASKPLLNDKMLFKGAYDLDNLVAHLERCGQRANVLFEHALNKQTPGGGNRSTFIKLIAPFVKIGVNVMGAFAAVIAYYGFD